MAKKHAEKEQTEWPTMPFGKLTINLDAYRRPVKETERRPGPYPYYGASGIVDYIDKFLFEGEHLLVAEDGENLRTRQTPIAFLARGEFWVNNHAHIVRANEENVTRFLMYALRASDVGGYLTGSTMPKLTQANLNRIPIAVPPKTVQQAIADILSSLDDKIELNRRINETLDAMARALFKSWFVEFEPVRAKVRDLIDGGVLEIGDGYRAKNSEMGSPGLPFVRAGDLNNGFDTSNAELLSMASVEKAGNKISLPGDVAFTSKGTIGRFARVTSLTQPFVYSPQVCFWRSLAPEKLDPAILYYWMLGDDLKNQVAAVARQTDMAPYVSLRDQREMEIPVFPKSQSTVAAQIRPLLARQDLLASEAETLTSLRDTLLPRLLNGELSVA